jgi:molybdate transport system substrate-binding protein
MKSFLLRVVLVFLVAVTAGQAGRAAAPPQAPASAELNVYAAASLTDAMKEIATGYEKAGGGKVSFNFGASSALARQIEEQAPADVFFSADEAKMDELDKRGLVQKETRQSLLSNSLVIVVPNDSKLKLTAARDLTGSEIQQIAVCEPQSVPAGIYTREYLQKLGLWEPLKGKIVPTENVRANLAAVESGNVEAGFVYRTDAAISKKVRIALEIPVAEGPAISYPVAVLRGSTHPEAAKKFLAYLESPAGLDVFRKYGFLIRGGSAR